ncbi:GTPase domain-containing protein [Rhodococcus qingshengii]|uniref:GTPase domain-containing protein n=1 Tax=Rhodococcus qingshengii TaxID=334542 RepID=UPI0024B8D8DC|nr:GTPase domain-containing protein [Rhodococcus qingshengii]MDJ0488024.1 GTPase domain-containing protein [Rhodococcus qingshengii]
MNTGFACREWSRMLPAESIDDACSEPIDQLRALAYRLTSIDSGAAEAVHSVLGSLTAPLELVVAGRAGVGRSSLARILGRDDRFSRRVVGAPVVVTESRAFDVPGTSNPDLGRRCVVYVVVDAVRDVDGRAIARVSDRVVVAANKADLFGPRWDEALGRAAEISENVGVPTVPVETLTGRGVEELFAALGPVLEAQWWGRVEQIGPALRRSGSRSIAGRDEIELYLSSDSAVLFGAAAAMMSPEIRALRQGEPPDPRTADDAGTCSRWWSELVNESEQCPQQRVSLIRRGYVRRWAQLGGDRSAPAVTDE